MDEPTQIRLENIMSYISQEAIYLFVMAKAYYEKGNAATGNEMRNTAMSLKRSVEQMAKVIGISNPDALLLRKADLDSQWGALSQE